MVGIHGINGVPEPTNSKYVGVRGKKDDAKTSAAKDDVQISSEALKAATVTRVMENGSADTEVRAERVAQARENIENGTYRLQEIVEQVAARISGFLGE